MKTINTLLESLGYDISLKEVNIGKPPEDDLEARLTYAERYLGIQPEKAAEPVSDKPEELVVDTGAESAPPAAEMAARGPWPEGPEVATDDK